MAYTNSSKFAKKFCAKSPFKSGIGDIHAQKRKMANLEPLLGTKKNIDGKVDYDTGEDFDAKILEFLSNEFQKNENMLNMSEQALEFYEKWTQRMDYINTTMRSIRKIQTECTILELIQNNPNMENTEYNGYVFDKVSRNDTLYQYNTYIPELKIVSRIVCREEFENYSKQSFHIFAFRDEVRFKQKIRIQPILN